MRMMENISAKMILSAHHQWRPNLQLRSSFKDLKVKLQLESLKPLSAVLASHTLNLI